MQLLYYGRLRCFCGNELPGWKDAAGSEAPPSLFRIWMEDQGRRSSSSCENGGKYSQFYFEDQHAISKHVFNIEIKHFGINKLMELQFYPELHKFAEQMRITVDPLYYYIKESNEVEVIEGLIRQ